MAFSVRNKGKLKGFVWVWMERVAPKKARVPQPKVIAVRVASLVDKDLMLTLNPVKFFTEPHDDGFPAVLVRLAAVTTRKGRPKTKLVTNRRLDRMRLLGAAACDKLPWRVPEEWGAPHVSFVAEISHAHHRHRLLRAGFRERCRGSNATADPQVGTGTPLLPRRCPLCRAAR